MARLRVALVDDSERIRARLAEMLGEIANVEIVFAADTEGEAVRLLAQQEWDVLILDLQLRIGTGLGVLKAMQGLRGRDGRVAMPPAQRARSPRRATRRSRAPCRRSSPRRARSLARGTGGIRSW